MNAERVLEPYLPKGDMDQFGYKEGGALYAYGFVFFIIYILLYFFMNLNKYW